ncbi:MAG: hypothetical protein WC901_08040, partial [Candidatus Margulisiibacteriota bacterium]
FGLAVPGYYFRTFVLFCQEGKERLMGNGEWKKKVPLASFFSTPRDVETAAPRGCFANGGLG